MTEHSCNQYVEACGAAPRKTGNTGVCAGFVTRNEIVTPLSAVMFEGPGATTQSPGQRRNIRLYGVVVHGLWTRGVVAMAAREDAWI